MLLCQVSPDLLMQPVDRWAEWFFDRAAEEGSPSTRQFEDEVIDLEDIEPRELAAAAPLIILERITELHERYVEWGARYSPAQLSQGLWCLFGYPCQFDDLLFAVELPKTMRERAMRSLVIQYRDYLAQGDPQWELPHGWHMLWDCVLPFRKPAGDLGDVALECLKEILALPNSHCQAAALHGLNHLVHPDRPAVVQDWIDRYATAEWDRGWLESCRDGKAM